MNTRTKYYAVIFDPTWTSEQFRYEIQEVYPTTGIYDDTGCSYNADHTFKIYKENCLFMSVVKEVTLDVWELAPTDELKLLDKIEDSIVAKYETILSRELDPVKARKTELAMLTHQPE